MSIKHFFLLLFSLKLLQIVKIKTKEQSHKSEDLNVKRMCQNNIVLLNPFLKV